MSITRELVDYTMLCPVLCTCGKELSAYYQAFCQVRREKMAEVMQNHPTEVLPEMMEISDELQPMMGEVLDDMNMTKGCCRQKLLTSVSFHEFH